MRPQSVAAAVSSLSLACFAGAAAQASGPSQKETREVAAFESVEVSAGIHARVSIGARKVEVEANDDVMSLVETKVEDGRLLIRFKRNSRVWDIGGVTVTVQAPSLRGLEASGGATIQARLARAEKLGIQVSGGGEVKVEEIDVAQLDASGSGGATMELSGKADALRLEFSGGSRLKGKNLSTKTARVSGSGGCTARFRASESVKGEISGGCELHVLGNAAVSVATSGGSSVDKDE